MASRWHSERVAAQGHAGLFPVPCSRIAGREGMHGVVTVLACAAELAALTAMDVMTASLLC